MYDFWTDHLGRQWRVPTIKGRLKCGKIPLHRILRIYVLVRDNFTCAWCGRKAEIVPTNLENGSGELPTFIGPRGIPVFLLADHVVSRNNGGSHHPSNLQTLCDSCNARKSVIVDRRAASGTTSQN